MKRILLLVVALAAAVSVSAKSDTLSYASAESVGMDGKYLSTTIDSLVEYAMSQHAFPGCQILVARHGKIVHHKSYGHHTYRRYRAVENDHIFDLASCSKVMGATIAMMKLVEDGLIGLDEPFSKSFPYFVGSNKEDVTLREFLAHQGGLVPSVNVYRIMYDEQGRLREGLFSYTPSEEYPIEVYKNMWARKDMREIVYKAVADSSATRVCRSCATPMWLSR